MNMSRHARAGASPDIHSQIDSVGFVQLAQRRLTPGHQAGHFAERRGLGLLKRPHVRVGRDH